MPEFDITILTDDRYVKPDLINDYIQNILTEENLLIDALKKIGFKVNRKSWSDPDYDWSCTRYACFRSTWDYFDRWPEFDLWLEKVRGQLKFINPYKLVRWNLDKHYLGDLKTRNIPVVDTRFIEPGSQIELKSAADFIPKDEFVIKPAVSGAARHTYRISIANLDAHEAIFQDLIKKETMLIQPFIESILTKGEISLMVFGERYSHAVLKKGKPGDFRVQDDFGGTVYEYQPSSEAITLAIETVKACPELPFYARIDLVWDQDDKLAVSELELVEPELFFRNKPESANLLALEIANRIGCK